MVRETLQFKHNQGGGGESYPLPYLEVDHMGRINPKNLRPGDIFYAIWPGPGSVDTEELHHYVFISIERDLELRLDFVMYERPDSSEGYLHPDRLFFDNYWDALKAKLKGERE